jgi:hypothetical protein
LKRLHDRRCNRILWSAEFKIIIQIGDQVLHLFPKTTVIKTPFKIYFLYFCHNEIYSRTNSRILEGEVIGIPWQKF